MGQRVVCAVTAESAAAVDALKLSGGVTRITTSVDNPLTRETLIGDTETLGRDRDTEAVTSKAVSPEVRDRNREAAGKASDTSLDGDHYCENNSIERKDAPIATMDEIPDHAGRQRGRRSQRQAQLRDRAQGERQRRGRGRQRSRWPWIVGGLVVLAVLARGPLAAMRRRRGGDAEAAA